MSLLPAPSNLQNEIASTLSGPEEDAESSEREEAIQGIVSKTIADYVDPMHDVPKDSLRYKLVTSPARLIDSFGKMQGKYKAISECAGCVEFDRNARGPRGKLRNALEENVIDKITHHYPDRDKPLNITSIGSGGCFQELVFIAKLISREGYQDVRITLIDKVYKKGKEDESVAALRKCVDDEILPHAKGAKVTIDVQNDLDTYLGQVKEKSLPFPETVLMIDLEKAQDCIDGVIRTLYSANKDRSMWDKTVLGYTKGEAGFCYDLFGAKVSLNFKWSITEKCGINRDRLPNLMHEFLPL